MQSRHLLSCTFALLLVTLSSVQPGIATPSSVESVQAVICDQAVTDCSGPAFDAACDMHTKTCADTGIDPNLITYPMTTWAIEPLRNWLSPEVYNALYDLVGGDDKGPNPVPPIPGPVELPVGLEYGNSLGTGGASLYLHASINASALGFGVQRNVTASTSIDLNDDEDPSVAPCEGSPGKCKKQGPSQVPCSDPRGCPDLIVDTGDLREGGIYTQSFTEDSCSVVEGSVEPGQRRLLRFTFTSPNMGEGDLIVGDPDDNPQWFEWGDCHNHWHFREYADYRLWTTEAYMEWREIQDENPDADPNDFSDGFVTGHKQGFCVIDIQFYASTQTSPRYQSCSSNQGISAGWADTYHYGLDGQWVDITDVEPGLYVLEAEVNFEHLYLESDYNNNSAAIFVVIPEAT